MLTWVLLKIFLILFGTVYLVQCNPNKNRHGVARFLNKNNVLTAETTLEYPSFRTYCMQWRSGLTKLDFTRECLELTSRLIGNASQAALGFIFRKAIRRTDERYAPDYYLDQIDRDYFTEYNFEEFVDLKAWESYHYFSNINPLLRELGSGEAHGFSFQYKDQCDTSDTECSMLAVSTEINDASMFGGRTFSLPGSTLNDTYVHFPSNITTKSRLLQLQIITTEQNPYMFDPSITKLISPVLQVNFIDAETNLRITADQKVQVSIPWNPSKYGVNENISSITLQLKPLINLSYSDYPVFKMTLVQKSQVAIKIRTKTPNLKMFLTVTKDYRPSPRSLCQGNVSEVEEVVSEYYIYPDIYFTAADDDAANPILHDYFLAVFPEATEPPGSNNSVVELSVVVFRANCIQRDDNKQVWAERVCRIHELQVNDAYVNCTCPYQGTYAAAIFTTPIFLEIVDEVQLEIQFETNYVIVAAVSSFVLLTVILMFVCYFFERKEAKNPGIYVMADPKLAVEQHFYLITVFTGGLWRCSNTTANVSLQMYGSNGTSLPFVIRENRQKVKTMKKNYVDSFLVSNFKSLGILEKIRLWRDDHGNHPDWLCRKVMIRCLRSGQTFQFLVDKKFTQKFYGSFTVHEVPVATEAAIASWKRLFREYLHDGFQNRHSWLSLLKCSPSINFSRCQRLICAASTTSLYFLLIYIYRGIFFNTEMVEPASFNLEAIQILVAICIFAITLPVELILRALFRCTKSGKIITVLVWRTRHNFTNRNEQVFGYYDQDQKIHSELQPIYFNQQGGKLEDATDFSLPGMNTHEAENWLDSTYCLRRFSYRQSDPSDWIRGDDSTPLKPNKEGKGVAKFFKNSLNGIEKILLQKQFRNSFPVLSPSIHANMADENVKDMIDTEVRRIEKQTKPAENGSSGMKSSNVPTGFAVQVVETSNLHSRSVVQTFLCLSPPEKAYGQIFPRSFIFIAWLFPICLLLGTAGATSFFGLQCGPVLTWIIFTDFAITFICSACILQPLYLILSAGIKAWVYRLQNTVHDWRFQVKMLKSAPNVSEYFPYDYKLLVPERSHPPLDESESFDAKLNAVRSSHRNRNIMMFVVHVILMALLLQITWLNFSKNDYLQVRSLQSILQIDRWGELRSIAEFYEYLHEVLRVGIYPSQHYNGDDIPYFADVPIFLADETSMLVGVPRLHQFRIDSESACLNSSEIPCMTEWYTNFGKGDFDPKWEPFGSYSTSLKTNDVWSHQISTKSFQTIGKIFDFPSSGYIAHFGRNFLSSQSVLQYLSNYAWIDSSTRAIFLELSTYNPNINLFVYTKLIAEISGSGQWVMSCVHDPVTLTDRDTFTQAHYNSTLHTTVLFVLTVLALLGKLGVMIREWAVYRKVVRSEVFLLGLTLVSLAIGLYRLYLVVNLKISLDKMIINDHVPFDEVAFWDRLQQNMFGLTFCFAVLMILQLIFKTKREFYMLTLCLDLTANYLLGQAFLLFFLLIAFAMVGYALLNSETSAFHSMPGGLVSLLQEFIDPRFLIEMTEAEHYPGRIFTVVFNVAVVIVGMNLFISILDHGFTEARRIAQEKNYWMSYFHFITKLCPEEEHYRSYPFIHPMRLEAMQRKSADFLRACVQTQELQRMQQILELSQSYAISKGFILVSNSLRKKRLRERLGVEKRLEAMKFFLMYVFSIQMSTLLTPDQVKVHSEFSEAIVKLKVKKFEARVDMLDDFISRLEVDKSRRRNVY